MYEYIDILTITEGTIPTTVPYIVFDQKTPLF